MAEISNSENLEGEETLANMTDQEKQEWATNFLEERGFSVNGGKLGEGKEDALKRAVSGTTRKPGSHKS
ncbi:MAG: hypothetical protein EXS48_01885 [Candidatus Staskawiczbacteria bacterium]|nr:hypothetical protein [Candidatus Staskawiczbacteria bacterium]